MAIVLNVAADVSIYDFNSLKAAVLRRMDRDDLDEIIPESVQLAESYMQRELRTMDQEITTPLVVGGPSVLLPDDCLAVRVLHVAGDFDTPMRATSLASLTQEFRGAGGQPQAYAQSGGRLYFAPEPADNIDLSLTYVAKFIPLTEATTNWIIDQHPDVYFYGVLAQACDHIQDDRGVQRYTDLFATMVQGILRSRAADKYGSGPLVPSGMRQVRGVRS